MPFPSCNRHPSLSGIKFLCSTSMPLKQWIEHFRIYWETPIPLVELLCCLVVTFTKHFQLFLMATGNRLYQPLSEEVHFGIRSRCITSIKICVLNRHQRWQNLQPGYCP